MSVESSPHGSLAPRDLLTVEIDESKKDQRLIDIIDALVDGIEDVARKFHITYEEYEQFRQLGFKSGAALVGLLDIWMQPLLERVNHGEGRGGTSANPEGPAYVAHAPLLEPPYVLHRRPDEPGTPLVVRGQVRSVDGLPLGGAELDIWHCDTEGKYSSLGRHPEVVEWNFRGRLFTGPDGRYQFRTMKPPPYRGYTDTLAAFHAARGRSRYRAAHIHFLIRHPSLAEPFITQMYFGDDPYVDYDLAPDQAHPDLVSDPVFHDDPGDIEAAGLDGPYYTVDFDFVLLADEPTVVPSPRVSHRDEV
jgi:catechol 1,2-dioxygenase